MSVIGLLSSGRPAREALPLPWPLQVGAFCLLWSSAFSVAKVALADCPPFLLLATRFLLAGALMLGAAAATGVRWRLTGRDIAVLVVLGIANNAAYLGLTYLGIRDISSGLSALIISANPVLTALLAVPFLSERLTSRKILGLVLGVCGVAVIVESRIHHGTDGGIGVVFTLAALVSLVTGTILFKLMTPRGGLLIGNGVQNLAGGIALAPLALSLESVSDIVPSWRLLAALAHLVLFVSIFGFLIWFQLLTTVGATAASAYHFMMPPLGMLFGWLLLNEHIELVDLLGILPVALGIFLVTRTGAADRPTSRGGTR